MGPLSPGSLSISPSAATSYKNLILSIPSLVAYWTLEETSGTTAEDFKGTADLTHTGGPTVSAPLEWQGQSLTYDGINDKSFVAACPLTATTDFSVTFLYRVPGNLFNYRQFVETGTEGNGWLIRSMATGAFQYFPIGGSPIGGHTLSINTTYHLAVVRRSSDGHVYTYKNGVESDDGASTAPSTPTAGGTAIASRPGGGSLATGRFQHIALFSSALTKQQIVDQYNRAFL